jgi:hypothetical protein
MEWLMLLVIGIVGRLVPHPPNATPIGAVAIISGWRFGAGRGTAVTLAVMLITDLFLGLHPVMWATYGSILGGVFLASRYFDRAGVFSRLGVTVFSSVLFYLVTNFAVWWLPGSMYPHTTEGLLESYIMALPFFRTSFVYDILYVTMFSSAYDISVYLRTLKKVRGNTRFHFRENSPKVV